MKRNSRLNKAAYFVCTPNDYWIKVTFMTRNSMSIAVCKEMKDGTIETAHKRSITIDEFDRKRDLNKVVKNFCEYFVSKYSDHSDLKTRAAALCLSACYTKTGLNIWKKRKPNPYA
jgi:hypothetical protein